MQHQSTFYKINITLFLNFVIATCDQGNQYFLFTYKFHQVASGNIEVILTFMFYDFSRFETLGLSIFVNKVFTCTQPVCNI